MIPYLGKNEEVEEVIPIHKHTKISQGKYLVSVDKRLPSVEIIRNSRAFVINFMEDEFEKCAVVSPFHEDKFKKVGLAQIPAEKLVDCIKVKEAVSWIECELEQEFESEENVVFVGKIVSEE